MSSTRNKKKGTPSDPIVEKVVNGCGGKQAVADAVGISRQAVGYWVSIPPHYCITLEGLCKYSRYAMRPDVFGPEPKQAAKAS